MKQAVLAILILFAFACAQAEQVTFQAGGASMSIEINGVENNGDVNSGAIIEAIAERLETLENEYVSQLKRLEQERAKKLISEIFALLVQLPTDQKITLSSASSSSTQSTTVSMNVNVSGWDTMDDPVQQEEEIVVVEPAGPVAMSGSDFAQLKRDVQAEDFGDDALGVVDVAVRHHHFSVDQIRQLVGLFDFSDEQIQVVQMTWPRVVDPENGHQLLSAFTYSDDKEQVRRIINQ